MWKNNPAASHPPQQRDHVGSWDERVRDRTAVGLTDGRHELPLDLGQQRDALGSAAAVELGEALHTPAVRLGRAPDGDRVVA